MAEVLAIKVDCKELTDLVERIENVKKRKVSVSQSRTFGEMSVDTYVELELHEDDCFAEVAYLINEILEGTE